MKEFLSWVKNGSRAILEKRWNTTVGGERETRKKSERTRAIIEDATLKEFGLTVEKPRLNGIEKTEKRA